MENLSTKVHPFLMFEGDAEEAMNLYTTVFDDAKIISITRYAANEAGEEGTVMQAVFSIKGQEFMCSDSNVKHDFTFTPSISMFVTCDTEEELDHVFEALSQEGQVYMPLDNYGFSKKFGWVGDKFGVTWQLNLA
ncbi:hypothetical protein CWR48_18335 [Oceanobacillus arenosus]|uniref:PhnB-like domain-containing protein n=1 Tax=Oceanobacillus arenosus TaxID=1229153 RepID=A0A3D8PJ74_9BACI|nr:VOC family protein [Oceanobacillus arenosus]RDW16143.1 hypothetical protein CWR48_18335 [Oceanobacillus arenosus]